MTLHPATADALGLARANLAGERTLVATVIGHMDFAELVELNAALLGAVTGLTTALADLARIHPDTVLAHLLTPTTEEPT